MEVRMTRAVFHEDSYRTELRSVVKAVGDDWVELDQTIFYPEGGGQPGDHGELSSSAGTVRVIDTRKGEAQGVVRHLLESSEPDFLKHNFQVGEKILASIDWERRYKLMRMHTCMHLLGSLVPVPVTGGQVGLEKSRLDFNLGDHVLDKEDLTLRMNKLVAESHELHTGSITEAELDDNPGLVRTMSVQPPRGVGDIRMIRVQDVDYQPCGGTHVRNTSEVGKVLIRKIENKGKQNRRVHIVLED
jgi:misacylated tRNA(Ala) deacylase